MYRNVMDINERGLSIIRAGMAVMVIAAVFLHAAGVQAQQGVQGDAVPVIALQDTLYVTDSMYLEVDLDHQEVYRHYSDGRIDTFLCSTGNPKLSRGLATRPGIFTIKWKAKRHVSSIFNVPMYYWMPFDGGIGFHSLQGDDYYVHLGYEPSSHGCVRMSNESGEYLYSTTPVGTIVYVHKGTPARVLRFAAATAADLRILKRSDLSLLRKRLDAVKNGRASDPILREKLAVPRKFASKIEVGEIPQ